MSFPKQTSIQKMIITQKIKQPNLIDRKDKGTITHTSIMVSGVINDIIRVFEFCFGVIFVIGVFGFLAWFIFCVVFEIPFPWSKI